MMKPVGLAVAAVGAAWWLAAAGMAAPTTGTGAATQPARSAVTQASTQASTQATTQAATQAASRPAAALTLDLGNNVKMELAKIPAGKFLMGSPESETDRASDESPQHEVTISRPFFMGIYEVTQAQYQQIMGRNPSRFKGANNPVENIKWPEAVEFCKKLSAKTGKNAHLPTEAQWEYACRAGSKTRFSFGDNDEQLGDYAWFDKNSGQQAHPVGEKKPNAFGLYDMHGNVWEWCASYQDTYPGRAETDPAGGVDGQLAMLRGGSWYFPPGMCRSAKRLRMLQALAITYNGLRVVVE